MRDAVAGIGMSLSGVVADGWEEGELLASRCSLS